VFHPWLIILFSFRIFLLSLLAMLLKVPAGLFKTTKQKNRVVWYRLKKLNMKIQNRVHIKTILNYSTLALLGCAALPTLAQTTVDDPNAVYGTTLNGIYGGNMVGSYTDSSYTSHAFVYSGTTFTELTVPGAANGATAEGIADNIVVGSYYDASYNQHGYAYGPGGYITLDDPDSGVTSTTVHGTDGTRVVGSSSGFSGVYTGFVYNGTTWTDVSDPLGVNGTQAFGVSGNNIVGYYIDGSYNIYAYLFDGSTWTTLNFGGDGSRAFGIQGNEVVGVYFDGSQADGYVYDIATGQYITVNGPAGATGTELTGIDGDTVTGYYFDSGGLTHGFTTTVDLAATPEPGTLMLGGLGILGFWFLRRRSAQSRLTA
jgi:hypothetical protein